MKVILSDPESLFKPHEMMEDYCLFDKMLKPAINIVRYHQIYPGATMILSVSNFVETIHI